MNSFRDTTLAVVGREHRSRTMAIYTIQTGRVQQAMYRRARENCTMKNWYDLLMYCLLHSRYSRLSATRYGGPSVVQHTPEWRTGVGVDDLVRVIAPGVPEKFQQVWTAGMWYRTMAAWQPNAITARGVCEAYKRAKNVQVAVLQR